MGTEVGLHKVPYIAGSIVEGHGLPVEVQLENSLVAHVQNFEEVRETHYAEGGMLEGSSVEVVLEP
jgi:hypothetical protein